MAITFAQEKKTRYYLILLLITIVVLACLFFAWKIFFAKPTNVPSETALKPPEIKINFEVLTNPILKDFQPFEDIKPTEEKVGRENPFLPY